MEPYTANDTAVKAEDTQEDKTEDEETTWQRFKEWFHRNKGRLAICGLALAGVVGAAIIANSGGHDQDDEDEPSDDYERETNPYQSRLSTQDHDIALESRHELANQEMPIKSGMEVTSTVGEHLRHLPEGWNRSEAKEQEMLEKGLIDLPTNVTTVDSFSRKRVY
ncbi:hypothetical protein [Bifidobacterium crudilactis]|jgi:hypothetical protein|uniref:hypothetical protein n=1 Tax=Bifidobacterium crudilactis TaxID=327277 RepID=UPI0023538D2E|nr:hypothetical protein [Bifidobacterium crudilactis]MCI1218510.1 hypothetical protein [Bifidobacterium crudilactis]